MILKFASFFGGAAVLAAGMGLAAQTQERPVASAINGAACTALKGHAFGDATVTESTPVPAGSLKVSDTVTIPSLPSFCRVQAVSKPSADSNIQFEVWLPHAGTWNRKFLSTGEGGFAGTTQLSAERSRRRDGRNPAARVRRPHPPTPVTCRPISGGRSVIPSGSPITSIAPSM